MTEEANVVNDPTDDQAPLLSYPPSSSKSILVNDDTDQKERKGTRFVIYMEQTMCLPSLALPTLLRARNFWRRSLPKIASA